MKIFTTIMMLVCFVVDNSFAEYRTWKGKNGITIEAEYEGMENGKVILLRNDGKKIEIDPDSLSAADQVYLDSLSSNSELEVNDDSSSTEQNLPWITAQKAKAIAEKYIEALNEQDFKKWQSLLLNPAAVSEAVFRREVPLYNYNNNAWLDEYLGVPDVKKARLKVVDRRDHGYDARIEVTIEVGVLPLFGGSAGKTEVERSYWIQMLPDGKIKYDDIYIRHPVKMAIICCHYALNSAKNGREFDNAEDLQSLGVPLFGYDPSADYDDQEVSLKKLKDWLKDEADEWDATEPQVSYPKKAYRSLIQHYFRTG